MVGCDHSVIGAEDEDLGANESTELTNTAISDEENRELAFTASNSENCTPQKSRPAKHSLTELDLASPSPQTSKIVIYPSLLEDIRAILSTIREARSSAAIEYANIQSLVLVRLSMVVGLAGCFDEMQSGPPWGYSVWVRSRGWLVCVYWGVISMVTAMNDQARLE